MRRSVRASVVVLLLASVSCSKAGTASAPSGSSGAPSAPASTSRSIDPNFDYGQTILITDDGFQPAWLVAPAGKRITWENQTDRTWTVVFDHQTVRSGPIPPGGSFTWRSATPISVTYHAGDQPQTQGAIQIQTV